MRTEPDGDDEVGHAIVACARIVSNLSNTIQAGGNLFQTIGREAVEGKRWRGRNRRKDFANSEGRKSRYLSCHRDDGPKRTTRPGNRQRVLEHPSG